jgi:type I restriction enzyme M protein
MDYWAETMQDDAYLIAADGWVAGAARIVETDKKGKSKDKGWTCDLIPKPLIVARYFAKEQAALEAAGRTGSREQPPRRTGGGARRRGRLPRRARQDRQGRGQRPPQGDRADKDAKDEVAVLKRWLDLSDQETTLKRAVKEQDAALDAARLRQVPQAHRGGDQDAGGGRQMDGAACAAVQGELDRVSQTLTGRIRATLPQTHRRWRYANVNERWLARASCIGRR